RYEDLAAYKPEWVQPISAHYRGYDIWEIPPNGQGIVALIALKILEKLAIDSQQSVDNYHKQIEAMKLAFADGHSHITDASMMKATVEELLSDQYAERRAALIGDRAELRQTGIPATSGTVYIATADKDGNMVSLIQSNYKQ